MYNRWRFFKLEKYIALFRGINISCKNKVSMPLLKAAFEGMGFLNVSTYINSGNVLFPVKATIKVNASTTKKLFLLSSK
ncbi:DUF1697 domain-containing protein [Clostridioides sp. ES-S-0005-03]|nr:DUF1697 domain-containing protein [Clostridioides sp. ES-S-0123-01]MCC0680875.1 DUF1697 domain-containing protein [Clostridioides sp. ES-S-0005-03]MCC0702708.1 DUF1697 domain-containing protein [Clostridioides sp. ES-S-0049-02]MCC0762678.1 DUF1697 domain-containing protein [Clostridioides sp. ES-S-0006-03]UDN49427.1 DUF1697 domain-containing protein [Clostridioides sp. ES-S-0173-01]UDN60115.1 DUF1697 domain-containing protein [Clostridioides sp. ES-S-0010-02]